MPVEVEIDQFKRPCLSTVKNSVALSTVYLSSPSTHQGPMSASEDLCVTLQSRLQWLGVYPSSPLTQKGPLRPNEDLCVTLPSRIQWFGIYPSSPPPNKAPLGTVRISVSLYSQEFLGVVSIHSLPPTIKAP